MFARSRVLFDANGGQEREGGTDERGLVVNIGRALIQAGYCQMKYSHIVSC